VTLKGWCPSHSTEPRMESTYSCFSAAGLVSSNRRYVWPPNRAAGSLVPYNPPPLPHQPLNVSRHCVYLHHLYTRLPLSHQLSTQADVVKNCNPRL
jgi:hypothetical protein